MKVIPETPLQEAVRQACSTQSSLSGAITRDEAEDIFHMAKLRRKRREAHNLFMCNARDCDYPGGGHPVTHNYSHTR